MSGKEDEPENYTTVTYTLSKNEDETRLSLSQDNIENEEAKKTSTKNWSTVLEKLKEVVEKKQPHSPSTFTYSKF